MTTSSQLDLPIRDVAIRPLSIVVLQGKHTLGINTGQEEEGHFLAGEEQSVHPMIWAISGLLKYLSLYLLLNYFNLPAFSTNYGRGLRALMFA